MSKFSAKMKNCHENTAAKVTNYTSEGGLVIYNEKLLLLVIN